MNSRGNTFFYLVLLFALPAMSLSVDSTLTIKIIETSESQRTIKINRGGEDGLQTGDHAKFFLTQSIIARAVNISQSKSESVWSIYRMVHPGLIMRGELMNLKITEPVKITSKKKLNIAGDTSRGMRIDQSANGDYVVYSDLIKDSEKSFEVSTPSVSGAKSRTRVREYESSSIERKKIELWTQMGFHFFSSTVDNGSGENFSASEFFNQFMGGLEFYLGRFVSVQAMGQYLQESLLSFDGAITDSVLLEYGGALQFYLTNPHRSYKPVIYIGGGAAMGQIIDAFAGGASSGEDGQTSTEAKGKTMAFFGGIGVKYHLRNGLGFRMNLDYYQRKDSFELQDDVETSWTRTKQGPRMMLGVSLRF